MTCLKITRLCGEKKFLLQISPINYKHTKQWSAHLVTFRLPTDVPTDPLQHEDYFGVRNLFSVSDLFEARVHLGHKEGTRNEYMTPFIFGNRLGVDILDLDQTALMLGDALNVMAHVAYREGVLLFLSRHFQTLLEVEKTAVECGEFSHCREWKGGTFTNATKQYGLVTRLPDLGIFVSTHNTIFEQHIGVIEMSKLNIPTVGVVDTSCDPRLITYPVPGNDDSPSAIRLYLRLFKEAILLGKAQLKKDLSDQ